MITKRKWQVISVLLLGVAMCIAVIEGGATYPRPTSLQEEMSATGELGVVDRAFNQLHVVHAHDDKLYAVEDHYVYRSTDGGETFQQLGRLSKHGSWVDHLRGFVARTKFVRTVRQYSGPKSLVVLNSGTILVFYDRIYRSTDGGSTFEILHQASAMPSGFPSSLGYAVGPGDTVYYGEYTTTARPHPVRVVRGTDDGRQWDIVHTFPSGEIFHIHAIKYDQYRNRLWITTGDRDEESRLLYTDDAFATLHVAGCCSQAWRAVDLIVTDSALYWGSDDDRDNPGIFRYDIAMGALDRVADLPNPSYQAAVTEDGLMAISTTFEPGSPLSTAGAPASVGVWLSRDGRAWQPALTFAADPDKVDQGKRPYVQFPSGDPLPVLFATPWFTEQHHFQTLRIAPEHFEP